MTDVICCTKLQFFVIAQKSSVISHTNFTILTNNLDKTSLSSWSEGYDLPRLFLVSAYYISFFVIKEFFCKWMVYIITLLVFMMRLARFRVRFSLIIRILNFNEFPYVILYDVISIRRTA